MKTILVMGGRGMGKAAAIAELARQMHGERSIFVRSDGAEAFASLKRYAYAPEPDPALTARPVQGSHRFMRDREPQLYQPPEIPAADPHTGFHARVDEAIRYLGLALAACETNHVSLTSAQRAKLKELGDF